MDGFHNPTSRTFGDVKSLFLSGKFFLPSGSSLFVLVTQHSAGKGKEVGGGDWAAVAAVPSLVIVLPSNRVPRPLLVSSWPALPPAASNRSQTSPLGPSCYAFLQHTPHVYTNPLAYAPAFQAHSRPYVFLLPHMFSRDPLGQPGHDSVPLFRLPLVTGDGPPKKTLLTV